MDDDDLLGDDEDHAGEGRIKVNRLAVGLTRPPTMGGVPLKPLMIGMFGVMMVFMATGNPFHLLISAPVYLGLRVLSAEKPRIFAEIAAWTRVNARCRNRLFWGGAASFSPRRTVKGRIARWG